MDKKRIIDTTGKDWGEIVAEHFTFEIFADVTYKDLDELYGWQWGTWEIDIDTSELCTVEDYQNTGKSVTGYRINIWLTSYEERYEGFSSGELEIPENYDAEVDYFSDLIERCDILFTNLYDEGEARRCYGQHKKHVECLEKFFPHHTFNFGEGKDLSDQNQAYFLQEVVTPDGRVIDNTWANTSGAV